MYGDLAHKLVVEAKRASGLSEIPLHLSQLVRDIIQEIADLNRDAEYLQDLEEQLGEERMVNKCQYFVTQLCLRRNKRCLLAYQKLRADRLSQLAWLNVDSATQNGKVVETDLSHAEQEYFKQYQELIAEVKSGLPELDLAGDLNPPSDIFIDVRVLKDGGEIQTEYGVFNLIKDSQFFVRKTDVDRLILQGYLEQL